MAVSNISMQTLKRLPLYLNYLKSLDRDKCDSISATMIAETLGYNDVSVRKDIATVSSSGKPKTGYAVKTLVDDLETFLGYNNTDNAVLIGAGKLGKALLDYKGFSDYGLDILLAFDVDENVVDNKRILPLGKLNEMCRRINVHIGIITVPAEMAQSVCDLLVDSGVTAIWNFSPTHLSVPDNVLVQNENMAASLALLSRHLKEKMNK